MDWNSVCVAVDFWDGIAHNICTMGAKINFEKVHELGRIALFSLERNDKRVANALHEALEILATFLKGSTLSKGERSKAIKYFQDVLGFNLTEAIEELLLACHSTAQYDRGLAVCGLIQDLELQTASPLMYDRAEFLAALGKSKEAEDLLERVLQEDLDYIWHYIRLGDIYYSDQIQDEKQDLDKAEQWYYAAYDRGLANGKSEDGRELLRRLGDVCVERLRRDSEQKLLNAFERLGMGTWRTLTQLSKSVYITGSDSVLLSYLQWLISEKCRSIDEANKYLDILTNAYNMMPQRDIDELSPFEMAGYLSQGEHRERIQGDMLQAYTDYLSTKDPSESLGALGAQEFTDFQINFMNEKDPVTGEKRRTLVDREEKRITKLISNGKLVWMGFLKYRKK